MKICKNTNNEELSKKVSQTIRRDIIRAPRSKKQSNKTEVLNFYEEIFSNISLCLTTSAILESLRDGEIILESYNCNKNRRCRRMIKFKWSWAGHVSKMFHGEKCWNGNQAASHRVEDVPQSRRRLPTLWTDDLKRATNNWIQAGWWWW